MSIINLACSHHEFQKNLALRTIGTSQWKVAKSKECVLFVRKVIFFLPTAKNWVSYGQSKISGHFYPIWPTWIRPFRDWRKEYVHIYDALPTYILPMKLTVTRVSLTLLLITRWSNRGTNRPNKTRNPRFYIGLDTFQKYRSYSQNYTNNSHKLTIIHLKPYKKSVIYG